MTIKKFFYSFFALFFFVCQTEKGEAQQLSCDVAAPIAILINADNGKVLFSKNAKTPCHPASTTKLMTAAYVIHKDVLSLDQKVKASHDAISIVSPNVRRNSGLHPAYRLEYGGTHMGVKLGEILDVKTLLYGLMLSSGNDAANILAEATSGSIATFMDEINDFVKAVGCEQTFFTSPHGMPDPLHTTTATDLALMARVAMKSPLFKEIVLATKYVRPKTNKQESYTLAQHNGLVKPGKYFYQPATGLKTGYTIKSGFVLVSSASKGDRNLIAVVMKCDEIAKTYRSSIALFEAAFNEPKQTRKLFSKEYDHFSNELKGAKQTLRASLKEDVLVSFYPSEGEEFHSEIVWLNPSLPIKAGEEVGFIQLLDQNEYVVQVAPLVASKEVEPTFSHVIKQGRQQISTYIKKKRIYAGYLFAIVLLGIPLCKFVGKKRRRKRDKGV